MIAGLKLADGAGRGIARIGENRQALAFAFFIHFLEGGDGHQHFAAHFKIQRDAGFLQPFFRDGKRNGADGADVERHVFADGAVAASDAANQFAVLVAQGQRHAVELQFAYVIDVFPPAQFVYPPLPVAQFVFAVGVIQREHGRRMLRLHETFAGFAADALGGRIGRDQLGMLGLELFQLVHELIEFSVRDFRIVEHVVAIFVVADFVAEGVDFLFEVSCGGKHDEQDYKAGIAKGQPRRLSPRELC